jgi:hypothetical protein
MELEISLSRSAVNELPIDHAVARIYIERVGALVLGLPGFLNGSRIHERWGTPVVSHGNAFQYSTHPLTFSASSRHKTSTSMM